MRRGQSQTLPGTASHEPAQVQIIPFLLLWFGFRFVFVLLLPHLFSGIIANRKASITVEEIAVEINTE